MVHAHDPEKHAARLQRSEGHWLRSEGQKGEFRCCLLSVVFATGIYHNLDLGSGHGHQGLDPVNYHCTFDLDLMQRLVFT
jgi:hypothetical protein